MIVLNKEGAVRSNVTIVVVIIVQADSADVNFVRGRELRKVVDCSLSLSRSGKRIHFYGIRLTSLQLCGMSSINCGGMNKDSFLELFVFVKYLLKDSILKINFDSSQ